MAPAAFVKITPEDFDQGFIDFKLAYRRGEPPPGLPDTLRLTVPDRALVANMVERFQETSDPFVFVRACLPPATLGDQVLGLLAFDCECALLDACYTLCFGEKLKQEFYQHCLPNPRAPQLSIVE